MGRYYWGKKEEADSLRKIEIWFLRKRKYLDPNSFRSGNVQWTNSWSNTKNDVNINVRTYDNPRLNISYKQTDSDGNSRHFDYDIPLVTTPCNLGGVRWWFTCPFTTNGRYCGRRVAVLYKTGNYFTCRHCGKLSYESRNENRRYRDFFLFKTLLGSQKIEDLEKTIKRKTYAGRPTRKQLKLYKLESKVYGERLAKSFGLTDRNSKTNAEALIMDRLYKR